MENATNALLIAGGVFIAIIIISLGVSLYLTYSSQSKEYSQMVSSTEVQKFNSKFEVFIGREDISAQEIVSAYNLAQHYDDQIEIGIRGVTIEKNDVEAFLQENSNNVFKCELKTTGNKQNPEYNNEGRITKIVFEKN